MPEMSTPSDMMCKCPSCGVDLKMNLTKSEPTMPMKKPGMAQMGAAPDSGGDMAGMIDKAAGGY